MSVTPKVLSRVMPEMVDMGATFRSSITVYVTTPCTNPLEQLAAIVTSGRREQRGPGIAGADVGLVRRLDAAVEVADGADHGVLAQDLDDRGDGQGEEGEEEVDDVLARLAVQHAPALGVHQQLHARAGDQSQGSELLFIQQKKRVVDVDLKGQN